MGNIDTAADHAADARDANLKALGRFLAVARDILGGELNPTLTANYMSWPEHHFAEIGKKLAHKCSTDEEWMRVVEAGAAIDEMPSGHLSLSEQGVLQLAMYREQFAGQRERHEPR